MDFSSTRNTLFWIYFLLFASAALVGSTHGLEGIPSWLSLGMRSPFVEFRAEMETLSNITINMNLTMIENMSAEPIESEAALMKEYNSFYRAGSAAAKKNQSTDRYFEMENVYSNMKQFAFLNNNNNQQQQQNGNDRQKHVQIPRVPTTNPTTTTQKPAIVNIATQTQHHQQQHNQRRFEPEVKIIEVAHDQYIKPLALQNMQPNEPKKSAIFQDSSTNIEDLKRHIVLLHNLTKQDKGFESKFVVFPNLKKDDTPAPTAPPSTTTTARSTTVKTTPKKTTTTTVKTTTEEVTTQVPSTTTTMNPPTTTETEIPMSTSTPSPSTTSSTLPNDVNLMDDMDMPPSERSTALLFLKPTTLTTRNRTVVDDDFFSRLEQVTSFPQVFLQNDQTPMVPQEESVTQKTPKRRQNNNNNRGIKGQGKNNNNQKKKGGGNRKNRKDKSNRMCKEVGNKFIGNCSFASNWNEKEQRQEEENEKDQITTSLPVNGRRMRRKQLSQQKKMKRDRATIGLVAEKNKSSLQRSIRSSSSKGNSAAFGNSRQLRSGGDLSASLSMLSRMNYPGLMLTNGASGEANETEAVRNQQQPMVVNLNPDLCYQVGGLTTAQKKLCVQNTSIMPAISRGARAAIQECKHQFKHRRFDCETVNDDSVFGPITSLGSPEMAFINALSAAGVASFIARACRDGQLTSCGCSRSSRPNQLNKDWTWGGCGDDLEFGYKFSQTFIDIREKEKKRGARGLNGGNRMQRDDNGANSNSGATITAEGLMSTTEAAAAAVTPSKDLLELQEKITKEILGSKLQEAEMKELQEKINRELMNSKLFNNLDMNQLDSPAAEGKKGLKKDRLNGGGANRLKSSGTMKARSLMNLHNNEVGRRAVIKKSRVTCKCHGVSGSCSLITCWQQLTSIREIGDYLREKYDEATRVKMNKRGRLQVHDSRYKVPTATDLVYLDESPDWCRANKQLKWGGTHGRVCSKNSTGLDSCSILCCGRGYNTKKIVVKERCNCKFHWCCQVKCDTCVKTVEEYTCK